MDRRNVSIVNNDEIKTGNFFATESTFYTSEAKNSIKFLGSLYISKSKSRERSQSIMITETSCTTSEEED